MANEYDRDSLMEKFSVDPSSPSGLRWRKNRFKSIIGKPAGFLMKTGKNYGPLWGISIDNNTCYAHRAIWVMINGKIPKGMVIDHLNGIPSDNRIENLSLKTNAHNVRARNRKNCDNTSGYHGVSYRKDMKKWCAQVMRDGKQKRIGFFKTAEEAGRAVDRAIIKWAKENGEEVRLLNFN
jgi:hypothetical protein